MNSLPSAALAGLRVIEMGQLIAGSKPDLDLHPYRINRF